MVLENAEHFKGREICALVLQNSEYIIIFKRSKIKNTETKWKTVSVKRDKEVHFTPSTQGILDNHLY